MMLAVEGVRHPLPHVIGQFDVLDAVGATVFIHNVIAEQVRELTPVST